MSNHSFLGFGFELEGKPTTVPLIIDTPFVSPTKCLQCNVIYTHLNRIDRINFTYDYTFFISLL